MQRYMDTCKAFAVGVLFSTLVGLAVSYKYQPQFMYVHECVSAMSK